MTETPWAAFEAVDASQAVAYHVRYLDQIRAMGDTREYKARSFEVLALQPGQRALDVGCGTGLDAFELARRVGPDGQVAGVDPSAALIDEARSRATAEWRGRSTTQARGGGTRGSGSASAASGLTTPTRTTLW